MHVEPHLDPVLVAFAGTDVHDREHARLREQLITELLPVARHLAHRYANRGEPIEDLIQVASIGLVYAIDRFDPARGYPFLGFAIPTITGEIRRHFRDKTWSMRVPRRFKDLHVSITQEIDVLAQRLGRAPRPSDIAAHLDVEIEDVLEALEAGQAYRAESLDAPLSNANASTREDLTGEPDRRIERFIHSHAVAPALAALPRREHDIVIMRFFQDMSQTQIAQKLGLSQMHVSRLLATTFTQLRDAVNNDTPDHHTDPHTPPP